MQSVDKKWDISTTKNTKSTSHKLSPILKSLMQVLKQINNLWKPVQSVDEKLGYLNHEKHKKHEIYRTKNLNSDFILSPSAFILYKAHAAFTQRQKLKEITNKYLTQ